MTMETVGTPKTPSTDVEALKPEALVERMKADNPKLAGKLDDKRMAAIVRGAFKALAAEVNEREEGRLQVPGLGRVVIRQVENEKEGQVVRNKRVILRPAQPKV